MSNTTPLTPLSQSIVTAAQQAAHRRHCRELGLPDAAKTLDQGGRWHNAAWLPLICGAWEQSPSVVAHLLGVPPPTGIVPAGKATNAIKSAMNLADEVRASQARLESWAARVQEIRWTQAQILQVMEEIEPILQAAFYDEQRLAVAAVGSYASLLGPIAKTGEDAGRLSLDIVAGLSSPDADLVSDLMAGSDAAALQQRHGHRGDDELELAAPRLGELAAWAQFPAMVNDAWQPDRARRRREEAAQRLLDQSGWLQRGTIRRTLEAVHALLPAHAQARDRLAQVLAATRRWVLTAASEGLHDGRLLAADDIFCLELEEIKQMMTGEWHSRAQVAPILQERKSAKPIQPAPASTVVRPLGIAGDMVDAPVQSLAAVSDIPDLATATIARLSETTPAWAALYLRAGGVIVSRGDLLCHAAAVGRGGGFPTLVGDLTPALNQKTGSVRLEPAQYGPALTQLTR